MDKPYDFCVNECDGDCPFLKYYDGVCCGTGCLDYEPVDKEVL